jgi:hypothetical protein
VTEFFTKDKVTMHSEASGQSVIAEQFPECCRLERRLPLSELTCHALTCSDTDSPLCESETNVLSVVHV